MTWLDSRFERRPLVVVEDHLYHTGELLAALAAARPDLIEWITVCGVDRGGPDTAATVAQWIARFPRLQVAARLPGGERVLSIADADLADAGAFARLVARLLRPGGVLVQDIQLSTLAFVPADRWWESIYTAATVRGVFGERGASVRFLSNKRGYTATFGRDLLDAGFDPRDVMDKADLAGVVPTIASMLERAFPLTLTFAGAAGQTSRPASDHPAERAEIDRAFDLVLWEIGAAPELGGRAIAGSDDRVMLRAGGAEAESWRQLIDDRLDSGAGISVVSVGERVAPPDAERAEITNLAARHAHTLRSRLRSSSDIVTAEHKYSFAATLHVARGTRRVR
jgi:hypothetical protein